MADRRHARGRHELYCVGVGALVGCGEDRRHQDGLIALAFDDAERRRLLTRPIRAPPPAISLPTERARALPSRHQHQKNQNNREHGHDVFDKHLREPADPSLSPETCPSLPATGSGNKKRRRTLNDVSVVVIPVMRMTRVAYRLRKDHRAQQHRGAPVSEIDGHGCAGDESEECREQQRRKEVGIVKNGDRYYVERHVMSVSNPAGVAAACVWAYPDISGSRKNIA